MRIRLALREQGACAAFACSTGRRYAQARYNVGYTWRTDHRGIACMRLHHDFSQVHYTIRSYGPGRVAVVLPHTAEPRAWDGPRPPETQVEVLTRSAVILPQQLIRDWPPQRIEEATLSHFEAVAVLGPELVLLGSGRGLRFPAAALLAPFRERGIGVEVMDTGAACRTYNILVTEGRFVAAVLMMIEGS